MSLFNHLDCASSRVPHESLKISAEPQSVKGHNLDQQPLLGPFRFLSPQRRPSAMVLFQPEWYRWAATQKSLHTEKRVMSVLYDHESEQPLKTPSTSSVVWAAAQIPVQSMIVKDGQPPKALSDQPFSELGSRQIVVNITDAKGQPPSERVFVFQTSGEPHSDSWCIRGAKTS